MSDKKIRVKELSVELGVSNKELLALLRDLDITAKSTMSTVAEADLDRIRAAAQSGGPKREVMRRETESGVIVRRRKKNPKASAPAAEAAPEAEQPAQAEDVTQKTEAAPAEETAEKPSKKPASPKAPKETAARIIKPAAEEAAASAEEAPAASSDAEEKGKAAKIVTPKEAAEADSAPSQQADDAASAVTAADTPAASEDTAEAVQQEKAAPAETPEPAETAAEGQADEDKKKKKKKKSKKREEFVAPQVRVISRPDPALAQPAPAAREDRPAGQGRRSSGAPAAQNGPGVPPAPGAEQDRRRNKGKRTVDFGGGNTTRDNDYSRGKKGKKGKGGGPETDMFGKKRHFKKKKNQQQAQPTSQPLKAAKRKIKVEEAIRVSDMAHQMGLKAPEIIKILMQLGTMATINQSLDIDTATVVAAEFGYEVEKVGFSEEDYLTPREEDKPEDLKARPAVITIMGHVDHGKTSLLDSIRKSDVTGGEAGGITQHIGAYHVTTKRGDLCFLDTPGHEAFTAMRARGAQVTDLVILVVAADDGVMEQTREAISHAKAAEVPIVVAVNKIDKEGANPERVMRELSEHGLVPEDWGGDTIFAPVSAKTRQGLDDLLELIALQAEVMELKANPDKPARGHIVEAKLDKGRGPVGTVLVQEGTLRQGDNFVCGTFAGRVRAMFNDQGKKVKEAGPSTPVEVQGFDGVPEAGEQFVSITDEKVARRIGEQRAIKQRERDLARESKVTLETFLARSADQEEALELNVVVKADVQGSVEAIADALKKQATEKVRVNIIHTGAGAITESDILLASASEAIIIGFNVRPTVKVKEVAEQEGVDIRFYDIIYKLVEEIKAAMAGLLAPVIKEVYLGQAEVRETFSVPKVGVIAGCIVADGKITRNAGIRLLRDGVVIYTGTCSSLKRFKDDAKEVLKGYECGIGLANFNDIKIGDFIEAFEHVEEADTL